MKKYLFPLSKRSLAIIFAGIVLSIANIWLLIPSVIMAAVIPFIVNIVGHTNYNDFIDNIKSSDQAQTEQALSYIEQALKTETNKEKIKRLNFILE